MRKKEQFINPAEGIITSSCGERNNPILDKQEFHDGIDIALAEGTELVAVQSGTVVEVRTSTTFGLMLRYQTVSEYIITYAHLQSVCVSEGEKIQQGQVIATSGNTGLSTGPHLHYGISQNDTIVDPMQFVSLPYTEEVALEYQQRGQEIPQK